MSLGIKFRRTSLQLVLFKAELKSLEKWALTRVSLRWQTVAAMRNAQAPHTVDE